MEKAFSREMRVHPRHVRGSPVKPGERRWREGRVAHSPRGARGLSQVTMDFHLVSPASSTAAR